MTPGERAMKQYETMRGLAKLDCETVHRLDADTELKCQYMRVIRGHGWYARYKWWVKRGEHSPWKRTGMIKAIDLIREKYEAEDEI